MTQSRTRQTSFVADVFKLVGGTTFAQVLSILVTPVLARLFAPEAFGIAALFASITGIVGVFVCMNYQLAVMLPESDEEAANLLGVSVGFVAVTSLLTVLLVCFGQWLIADLLKAPEIIPYLWLVPPVMFADGLFKALNYWNSRTKQFGRLSIAHIIASAVGAGAKVGAGLTGWVTGGALIGATALGSITSTAVLGGQIWRDDKRLFRDSICWQGLIAGLRRYYKFPLFSTWGGLVNTLSWQLPVLMLSSYFSPTVVGYYSLGHRLARLPLMLVGRSVAQVFYQRAADASHAGDLGSVVSRVFERLAAYSLFPMLLVTLTGRELFGAVFGAEWIEAGVYSQILSVYMFFQFISAPLGQLFSILEKQEVALITNVLLLLSRVGALLWGGRTGNVIFSLSLFSLSGVLVYGGYSMWIVRAAGMPIRDWFRVLRRFVLVSVAFLGPAWLLSAVLDLHSWLFLVPYALSAGAYYVWLLSTDRQITASVRKFMLRLPGIGSK